VEEVLLRRLEEDVEAAVGAGDQQRVRRAGGVGHSLGCRPAGAGLVQRVDLVLGHAHNQVQPALSIHAHIVGGDVVVQLDSGEPLAVGAAHGAIEWIGNGCRVAIFEPHAPQNKGVARAVERQGGRLLWQLRRVAEAVAVAEGRCRLPKGRARAGVAGGQSRRA